MREIKFRAWDREKEEMMITFGIWSYGGIHDLETREIKDLILMQYTGLKDKNGKEIYEGDVIKTVWKDDYYEPSIDPVKWDDEWAGFDWLGTATKDLRCTYEVIGNIYENHELLKGRGSSSNSS